MRALILNIVLAVALLCTVCNAAQTLVSKQRSTALLSAGASVVAQRKSRTATRELGLLQQTQSQMSSDIDQVQKAFEGAVLEFGHWVQKGPATATNSSIANAATKRSSKKVNASLVLSPRAPSTEKLQKKEDPVKPVMKKSSNVMAAVGRKAHVRQVAEKQETVLENLFKHLKGNIVNLKKQESSAKENAAKAIQRLQARMKADKEQLQKKGLSKFDHDRLENQTRVDTFELQYWQRDRSLGHEMFHSNLKLQHGLMSRVHQVIAACKEAALNGHVDPEMMKKLQAQALPKAFIQMRSNLKRKAQQYYAHVLTARWMVESESDTESA